MSTHVTTTVQTYFCGLRQIQTVRWSQSHDALIALVCALLCALIRSVLHDVKNINNVLNQD